MSSSYRMELDRWLARLDVTADSVFDVGGSQLPLKGRTRSWNVTDYTIIDLADPHIGSPKPDIEFNLESDIWSGGTADRVFCLEVFDYIVDPISALQNIRAMIEGGGMAWVTFPSQYPLHQPVDEDSLRYMPGGIKKLAAKAGLNVSEIIYRRFETNLFEQMYRAERMRAAKHEDHNFSGLIVKFTKANE